MKLIASDYDGTFYINDDDIRANIEAVKIFRKENIFVLATGRSYVDANEVINLYNIPYDYLLIDHGATIIKNNTVIYRKQIDNTIKNELVIDLKKRAFVKSIGYDTLKDNHCIEDDNLTKMYIKYTSIDDARYIDDIIKRKYSDKINAYWMHNNIVVEIVSKDADKANAIREIAKLENIFDKDIYTIGDNTNDIFMLKQFNGFIMSNSIKEIKNLGLKEYSGVSILIKDVINNNV